MPEYWDAYLEDGTKTEIILTRGKAVPDGLYHIICEVLLRHKDGSYLLMQRSSEKPYFPGWLEASAGGSALLGEDPIRCIKRELSEETGVLCENFTQIGKMISPENHSIFYSYLAETDCNKEKIHLQKGETEAFYWYSEEDFIRFINSGKMIPTQYQRYREYFEKIGYIR